MPAFYQLFGFTDLRFENAKHVISKLAVTRKKIINRTPKNGIVKCSSNKLETFELTYIFLYFFPIKIKIKLLGKDSIQVLPDFFRFSFGCFFGLLVPVIMATVLDVSRNAVLFGVVLSLSVVVSIIIYLKIEKWFLQRFITFILNRLTK